MEPKLIGLYSAVRQSGKSTLADHLKHCWNFKVLRFSAVLKKMVGVYLESLGMPEDEIKERLDGNLKESPVPGLEDVDTRKLLEFFGTEGGRAAHRDIWVKPVMASVKSLMHLGYSVVIDDVRFPNEAGAIWQAGGKMVEIKRLTEIGKKHERTHSSEGALKMFRLDMKIINQGLSVSEYLREAEWLFQTTGIIE